jgi:hypothetical protein
MAVRLPGGTPKEWVKRIQTTTRRAPKPVRIVIGCLLILGGIFSFLPILGIWMLPLGIMVLSTDVPWVRRRWRRFLVWFEKRRRRHAAKETARS